MLTFLADMGISTKTVTWLKSNGYNTYHLLDLSMQSTSPSNKPSIGNGKYLIRFFDVTLLAS